jgi:hypothetical protein
VDPGRAGLEPAAAPPGQFGRLGHARQAEQALEELLGPVLGLRTGRHGQLDLVDGHDPVTGHE